MKNLIHFNNIFCIYLNCNPCLTLNSICSCAGICVYEGRGQLCSVRLSTPLLKLRPRTDLVETLLVCYLSIYSFVIYLIIFDINFTQLYFSYNYHYLYSFTMIIMDIIKSMYIRLYVN